MQMTDSGWAYFAQIGDAVQKISATSVVGVICRNMLGPVGGIIAIIGVIILPITSGDTALRSLRLILSDALHIRQDSRVKRILLAVPVFAVVFVVLIWAKMDANGFNTIWRYFGWSNQTLSIFALSSILIWFLQHDRKRYFWIPLIPLVFYSFITCAYILNARIGLSLPYGLSIAIGVLFAVLVAVAAFRVGNRQQHPEE